MGSKNRGTGAQDVPCESKHITMDFMQPIELELVLSLIIRFRSACPVSLPAEKIGGDKTYVLEEVR